MGALKSRGLTQIFSPGFLPFPLQVAAWERESEEKMLRRGAAAHCGQQSQLPSGPVKSLRRLHQDGRSCKARQLKQQQEKEHNCSRTAKGQGLSQRRQQQEGRSAAPTAARIAGRTPVCATGPLNHGCADAGRNSHGRTQA